MHNAAFYCSCITLATLPPVFLIIPRRIPFWTLPIYVWFRYFHPDSTSQKFVFRVLIYCVLSLGLVVKSQRFFYALASVRFPDSKLNRNIIKASDNPWTACIFCSPWYNIFHLLKLASKTCFSDLKSYFALYAIKWYGAFKFYFLWNRMSVENFWRRVGWTWVFVKWCS